MDQITNIVSCPICHKNIQATDYFCFNCGKDLKKKPTVLTTGNIILYLIGSLILPPMGAIWGYRFIKNGDGNSKKYGLFLIILTIVLAIVLTFYTIDLFNKINDQVNTQMQQMQGF